MHTSFKKVRVKEHKEKKTSYIDRLINKNQALLKNKLLNTNEKDAIKGLMKRLVKNVMTRNTKILPTLLVIWRHLQVQPI